MRESVQSEARIDKERSAGRMRLLTSSEAAQHIGITETYLRALRTRGGGPEYLKLSATLRGGVRYTQEAIDAWIAERTIPRKEA